MEKYIYRIFFIIAIITSLIYSSNPIGEKGMMLVLIPFVILVLLVLANIIIKKKIVKFEKCEMILIGSIVVTYVLYCIVTRGFSFRELYAFGAIIIGIIIVGSIILEKDSKHISKLFMESFVFISFALSMFGLYCHQTKTEIWIGDKLFGYQSAFGSGTGGILSIMQNVNSFALVCVVAAMISIILYFMTNSKVYKGAMIISALVQTALLFVMASRTTLLMLAAFVGLYFVFFFKSKYKKYIYVLGVISIAVLVFIVMSGRIPSESALWYKMFNGDITSGRMELWTAAVQGIKDNLLFGVGIRNVVSTIGTNMGNLENTLGAHNGYISVLLANGLLVFTSIMSIIIYNISKAWRNNKYLSGEYKVANQLMICFCLAMLIGNLTESSLFGDFNFATVMLWIMLVITSKAKSRQKY